MSFQTIPTEIFQLFEEHGSLIKIDKGHQLFQEGEKAHHIFLIKSGIIQLSKETEQGKELTLRICGDGVIIGESSPFCQLNYHMVNARALETATLLSLSHNTFELLVTEHPKLMMEYLQWVQIESMKHQSRLRDLMLHGKKGALYSTLIRLTNTYGEVQEDGSIFINFTLTNTELANLCATSRELINRMLNDLKKRNIISFNKSYITVHDLQFLKNEINCENCPLTICRID
ncbi:Crp/Fnr family transcriptional regulator [Metasolibacillus sp.]|uniref:Crp/Fnr family transcriptional regulator n=1 Tax=Metasolibacillus sp. TaxID=2703680 RepID=UPI0025E816B0|nr:Crp/Fnr family transcriptional regulator [Metasolibacillus sp.]MCT6926093.1 Crp/Fnr family transcriptional regulator [Metasolibacillus sp.]MCT6942276.1 Crp/Fnr family transcriptional regulator [Metasolibacillus sp.]